MSKREEPPQSCCGAADSLIGDAMIHLTRLNNQPVVVNSALVLYIESSPDTLLTLTNGERLHVRESVDEVIARALEYQRRAHSGFLTILEERS